jgi:hypothetical protein
MNIKESDISTRKLRGKVRRPSSERVIIMTRLPVAGKVKTRLIPALGARGAMQLHRILLQHTILCALALGPQVDVEVCVEGADSSSHMDLPEAGIIYTHQRGRDLGERMYNAFRKAFREGCERAVLVGSDIPGLRPHILMGALEKLRENDVVIGPAQDGGYYLIGLNEPEAEIFHGVPWGTEAVLKKTLEILQRSGLVFFLVETLRDVDRPEDLAAVKDLASLNGT